MMNRPRIRYQPAVRRKKSFLMFSQPGRETCAFTPDKTLGEGTNGEVRLFTGGEKQIAVKRPKDEYQHHLTPEKIKEKKREIQKEFDLMSRAYPHKYNSLHHHQHEENDGNGTHYTYRMTQPFIEGKPLKEFVRDKLDEITESELASIILNVAAELRRLHNRGIIHGDAGSRNILITKHGARFIDFGMAYYKRGLAITGYASSASDEESNELAPERVPDERLKAHPGQDVFSLAKTLRKVTRLFNDDWLQEFYEQYPAIESFIDDSITDEAKERPKLQIFVKELGQQISDNDALTPTAHRKF